MRRVVLGFGCVALWLAGGSALAQAGASGASSPAVSQADDNVARGLFQAGKSAYEAGNFKEALQFFEQAYSYSPRPGFLFNIGQAADRLRQDDKALASFKAYLERGPDDAQNRAAVQQRVDALEEAKRQRDAAAAVAPSAVPSPASVAAQAELPAAHDEHSHAPSHDESATSSPITKKWWFWTGLGAVIVGGTVVAIAVAQSGGGGQAPLYQGSAGAWRAP
jgi:tetratricopeptide (TPR) repeat protein